MTALLEVPAIRERVFPVPVELYHRLAEGQKTELLRGTIIEKMSKSPLHIFMANRLHKILSAQIKPGYTVFLEGAITTSDSEPEPDVFVVRGDEEQYRTQLPTTAELVVEVAVTSIEIDRIKAQIYADAGVKEYWIVCPREKKVEVFRNPAAEGYTQTQTVADCVLECAAVPGVKVNLETLFA